MKLPHDKTCSMNKIHLPFNIWKGSLIGLPGRLHRKTMKAYDLNIFLETSAIPGEVVYTSGFEFANIPKMTKPVILLPVRDMQAPSVNSHFKWTINETVATLIAGKSVAISCQGGHGRTGTILSILWGLANPSSTNPVNEVRTLVCQKEVETNSQLRFIWKYLKLGDVPEEMLFKPPVFDDNKWFRGHSGQGGPIIGSHSSTTIQPIRYGAMMKKYDDRHRPFVTLFGFKVPIYQLSNGSLTPRYLCGKASCDGELGFSMDEKSMLCLICKTLFKTPDSWDTIIYLPTKKETTNATNTL